MLTVVRPILWVACLALLGTCARTAAADPAPPSYAVDVDASSVEICAGRGPPNYQPCSSPMLREDSDGGVVSLPGTVGIEDYGTCYVDECVPPGSYRYGCETPLTCSSPYWVTVVVTAPPDGGCVRVDGSAPLPFDGSAPWPADAESASCPQGGGGCGCSTAGSAAAFGGSVVLWSMLPLWFLRRWRRAG